MKSGFVLKGDICYSRNPNVLHTRQDGYLVCEKGRVTGVFEQLPERYGDLPLSDFGGKLILPGLVDLHCHGPQFAFRGLGLDLELLDWLEAHTFPNEAKYRQEAYARTAYAMLVEELRRGPNTRVCLFGTIHLPATLLLMDLLEQSGLVTMVGKVNMDRNCPDILREESAAASAADTRRWLKDCAGRYRNTRPILTPRFIPACSGELMRELGQIQREYHLPLQSHLSENPKEVAWVKELCPQSSCYGDAYRAFGLFGAEVPTIMAHCVWSEEEELSLLKERGVWVAHCPQSNTNLSSGIAPVRRYLDRGLRVGLGSDVAGGCHTSIFRAMADAIQVSKLRWRLVEDGEAPLSLEEAFYLGTVGGGSFFGKVGSFEPGWEMDALIIDDAPLAAPFPLTIPQRLARVVYLSDDRHIVAKYVGGSRIF